MNRDAAHPVTPAWSAWRTVVGFGLVSLTADMVYEGARSVTGPFLASLGASALLVGLISGAGEAIALVLRLFFGSLADRTGNYWSLTIVGYGLTAVCVPLMAVAPFLGSAGLALACVLILAERTGKAVRSPSKSALLAQATTAVGRGRGMGVHKALDQIGAFAGPLVVAVVIAVTGTVWGAFALLAIPGLMAMMLLVRIRSRVPDLSIYEPAAPAPTERTTAPASARSWLGRNLGAGLPRPFFVFAVACGAITSGLVTFGLIGFHISTEGLAPVSVVPVLYAAAMAAAAIGALASGLLFDRLGGSVLYALPFLVSAVPALALSNQIGAVFFGVIVWGTAGGIQDSTVKALVADLVPAAQRATAYGVFAAIQGACAILGGVATGYLYGRSLTAIVLLVGAFQALALALLVSNSRATRAQHQTH